MAQCVSTLCGSGGSFVAAGRLGRSYYGFDIVADYCGEAKRRLTKLDSDKPLKVVG